jgi:cytochrome c oxidase cbb3-type subunit 3
MCHGLNGTVGDRAPALAANRRYLRTSDQDLFDAVRKGIPGTAMPALPLPENDIWKVVAYIRSLRATASDAFVKGDVAHGEQVFWGKGRCAECHTINGRGGLLGPELSNIGGERSLTFIKKALTETKPHIPRGYQPVRVVAKDGQTVRGIVKNENNFSLQVLGEDLKLHLFTRSEVREVTYESKSLMPSNYDKVLTPAEFQDLVAFLSRQARGEKEAARR